MGTRSAIGIIKEDGIQAVYCHSDGYPKFVGKILFENYDEEKVVELIKNGWLSSLGKDVNPKSGEVHDFDNRQEDVCVFYGRDRGDEDAYGFKYKSKEELIRELYACEYFYLLEDGKWTISSGGEWTSLEDRLVADDIIKKKVSRAGIKR